MILLASMEWIAAGLASLVGLAIGYALRLWKEQMGRRRTEQAAGGVLETARREADAIQEKARSQGQAEAARLRAEATEENSRSRRDIEAAQARLEHLEKLVNRQMEGVAEREQGLRTQREKLARHEEELVLQKVAIKKVEEQGRQELERVAGLSVDDARTEVLRRAEQTALKDAADLSRHILEEARLSADAEAKRIITLAMQRYAGTQHYELTTAAVSLNGISDIKGRIIGRDGRNIRAFETATGVTVLIDDTPNTVVLSGFDPVRREIARRGMELLISDGRIHPTRIEEVIKQVNEEVNQAIREAGNDAIFRLGLHPVHEETLQLLGRLRFRQSYSQNILDHSIEVAHIAGLMAAELGADVGAARRAGLLHDIGKAINHEIEGSHAIIGGDFLKHHGENAETVNAVAAHHDEVPPASLVAVLVSVADALSASRPGARSESMTHYLKRLESLERIGASFDGVDKCYAVQAGRELRVIVTPEEVDDDAAARLAQKIVRRIEEELQYPGQIRVTVVREKRVVEFAK
jgi:ribonuclease Y